LCSLFNFFSWFLLLIFFQPFINLVGESYSVVANLCVLFEIVSQVILESVWWDSFHWLLVVFLLPDIFFQDYVIPSIIRTVFNDLERISIYKWKVQLNLRLASWRQFQVVHLHRRLHFDYPPLISFWAFSMEMKIS